MATGVPGARILDYIFNPCVIRADCLLQITPILKGKMMEVGTLMVGYQPLNEIPNFFRNIISSAAVTKEDVDFLLSELDRLGQDL